jgi:hypothetical protein
MRPCSSRILLTQMSEILFLMLFWLVHIVLWTYLVVKWRRGDLRGALSQPFPRRRFVIAVGGLLIALTLALVVSSLIRGGPNWFGIILVYSTVLVVLILLFLFRRALANHRL